MLGRVPWFIDNRQLRTAVWLMGESIAKPLLRKMDEIMGALVTVDSDVLSALTTLSQAVDTEIQAALDAGKLQAGDVTGIQSALADAKTKLDTAVSAGTATSPTDPTAPADGGTAAPADPTTTDGTGTPVDPATGAPTDSGTPTA